MLAILGGCARGINDYRHKLDAGRLCTATSGNGLKAGPTNSVNADLWARTAWRALAPDFAGGLDDQAELGHFLVVGEGVAFGGG